MHTQIYRDAQRTLRKVKRLDPGHAAASLAEIEEASQALTMYAEHTWGYHSSVYEPWHPQVQMLEVRKQAYAAEASKLAYRALDKTLVARQGALLAPHRPLRYEVINTEPAAATLQVAIPLDGWEHVILKKTFKLIDESTGQPLPYQLAHTGASYGAPLQNPESPGYCIFIRPNQQMFSLLPRIWRLRE